MGRQIGFYMLEGDVNRFLKVMKENASAIITSRDSPTEGIESLEGPATNSGAELILWNRDLLPNMRRDWIHQVGSYRIDEFKNPVLEFSPSMQVSWLGYPALCQGRLYGTFEGKAPEFVKWYEKLSGWIRKNFSKTDFGGYAGPYALRWQKEGGYFLPGFSPAETREWKEMIERQHKI